MNNFKEDNTTKLSQYLDEFGILTPEEIANFLSLCEYKTLKKGDLFSKENTICKQIGFVLSGIFRSYYFSTEEEEVTYCFIFQDSFITAYSSFISQRIFIFEIL